MVARHYNMGSVWKPLWHCDSSPFESVSPIRSPSRMRILLIHIMDH